MASMLGRRSAAVLCIGIPILVACLFAGGRQQVDNQSIIFEEVEDPALGLIQRKAELIVSKKVLDSEFHELAEATKSTTTISTTTTESATEVSANGVGNTKTFFVGLTTDVIVILLCLVIFWWFKRQYPIMMCGNEIEGWAPKGSQFAHEGFFGWMKASWALKLDDVWHSAGLDQAQLLQYTNMNMKLFAIIGLPFFFIIGPLNCFFGGNAAGADHLSWFSMGNVRYYQPWLYYVYALCIWYVVVWTDELIHDEMRAFIPRRQEWLKGMAEIRSNTLRMEGIPEKFQSDQACKAFWDMLMPGGRVKEVHIAKDTQSCGLLTDYNLKLEAEKKLMQAEAVWAAHGKTEATKPMYKPSMCATKEEAIPYWQKVIAEVTPKIAEERKRIFDEAKKEVGGVNMGNGFVTFKDRKDAEVALRLDLSSDADEWILEYAPEPDDVLWADMTQDPTAEGGRLITGYLLTIVLVIVYLPLVVGITNIATEINLGPLQSLWSSEAPSLGLTIMVDFLPTFLHLIFQNFFSMWDHTNSQLQLSRWFFWMQVLYIILIAALGTSVLKFAEILITDPTKIFELLSSTMPNCTHYYMNYLCMQWYSQAMVLTRYMPVSKYRMFTAGGAHEDKEAKDMAEPEDQDYYGMGSRSGRWATFVGIGLVFGTLSPPIDLLLWCTMFILRTIYGWNFCFSETKKSDTGGAFFVQALGYSYISLHIYMILMLGVLYYRSPNIIPTIMIVPAWVYVFVKQRKFFHYSWERLPYPELTPEAKSAAVKPRELPGTYEQPELHD